MQLDLSGFDKRKLMRVVAVVAVALAVGHLVQTLAARQTTPQTAKVQTEPKPVDVVQLAATTTPAAEPTPVKPPLPAAALVGAPQSLSAKPATPAPVAPVIADACAITLDLLADPGAMIGPGESHLEN